MRPIFLTMKAFGSYAKETKIDFTKIAEPLFLITGDTGAGKSTIFDAMVFALYGKSAAAEGKEGEDLKSHYGDDEPSVTFRFIKHNKEYEIKRSPRYSRMKKRGTGAVSVSEKLSLTLPDGTEFLGKIKEINEKIEDIIGLTKAQFMQVAMIAQGEFMALLRAKSDEKKEVFRKLFNTGKFEKIVNALDDKKKELRRAFEQAESRCKADVSRIKIANESILTLKKDIINGQRMDIAKVEEFLRLAEADLTAKKTRQSALLDSVATLKINRDGLRDSLKSAEELKKDFDRLLFEEGEFKEFIKQETNVSNDKKLAGEIENAYEIKDAFVLYEKSRAKVRELKENLDKNEKILPKLTIELKAKTDALTETEEQAKIEVPKLQETIQTANDAMSLFAKIRKREQDLTAAKRALDTAVKKEEIIKKETETLKSDTEAKKKELETLTGLDAKREKLKTEYLNLEAFGQSAGEYKKLADDYNESNEKLKAAQEEYKTKSEAWESQDREYAAMEKLFFDSQAGILAATLKPNEACPVCGSLKHPAPAKLTNESVKKEDLEKLKQKLKKADKARETAANAANAIKSALEEKEKIYKAKQESIEKDLLKLNLPKNAPGIPKGNAFWRGQEAKPFAGLGGAKQIIYLRNIYKAVNNELAEKDRKLSEDEERYKSLSEFVKASEEKQRDLEQRRENEEKRHRELINQVSLLDGEYKTLIESKKFDDEKKASIALKSATDAVNFLESSLKQVRLEKDRAKSKVERVEILISQYKATIPREEKEEQALFNAYSDLKDKYDLSDEEWQNLTDTRERDESKILKAKAEKFERDKATRIGRIASLRERVANKVLPDIEGIRSALSTAERELSENEEKLSVIKESVSINSDAFLSLKTEMVSRKKVLTDYETHENLYKKLSGKFSGSYLDIETFVQRYYLEEILQLANERLLSMTADEYELRLLDVSGAEEKRNRGLDLMVYSFVTGKIREMRTLSGGESFLAALSLALGMADRIEALATAVSPDILFIDEGFGSLDDNARREAVRTLKKVAGNNRLIAIISHVTELRREMETKLVVSKTSSGSKAIWES
ncbi:MAG: AAA family ATPase [Selenomonadaceae bacterium]|nr:AAA family ATPase [Selenomonadaceae bacterium]